MHFITQIHQLMAGMTDITDTEMAHCVTANGTTGLKCG